MRRGRCIAVLIPVLACAGPRGGALSSPSMAIDCETLRDETVRACVLGFQVRREQPRDGEDVTELEFALGGVCPYAGAIAWSGCHRGALERFRSHNALGACGDRGDYVEASIETSCMRPFDLPLGQWNDLVRKCFQWAEVGGQDYTSSCLGRPVG